MGHKSFSFCRHENTDNNVERDLSTSDEYECESDKDEGKAKEVK